MKDVTQFGSIFQFMLVLLSIPRYHWDVEIKPFYEKKCQRYFSRFIASRVLLIRFADMKSFSEFTLTSCLSYKQLYLKKQPLEVFYKKRASNDFTKFTGKHLCWSHFFNKVAGRIVLSVPVF